MRPLACLDDVPAAHFQAHADHLSPLARTSSFSEYARVAEADAKGLSASVPKIFGVRRMERLRLDNDGRCALARLEVLSGRHIQSHQTLTVT